MEPEKKQTGYPSIDKPWLKYYSEEAINAKVPECAIYEYLWENNKNHLDNTALIYFGKRISYRMLFSKIDAVEKALRSVGVIKGQIVTINLPSTPEAVYLLYAIWKIGAIANMIDPRLDKDTLKYYLNEAKSEVFIYLDRCAPIVNAVLESSQVKTAVYVSATESLPLIKLFDSMKKKPKPAHNAMEWKKFLQSGRDYLCDTESVTEDIPALMTHTSGTTGIPKGVVLSHGNVNAVAHQYSVGMKHDRSQKYLCIIPPFVAFGVCVAIHLPLGLGMSVVLVPQFDAEKFPKYLKKYRPEHFTCAPMSMEPLIKSQCDLDLSFLITPAVGGDYIKPAFEHEINTFLSLHGCKHQLVKGYGMTEVSSSACTTSDYCNESGSVGIPLSEMIISVFAIGTSTELPYRQEGEICFTGPNVMKGYFENPQATSAVLKQHEDGKTWMHSGDVGYMTEEGHLFVIDRLKRVVEVDGQMILPSKTEQVILSHPSVDKCTVVPTGHAKLVAYIVSKGNADKSQLEKELAKCCAVSLPVFAQPVRYVFRGSLPLTPVGKIDYRALEKEAEKNT